jgi:hypothetical protein
MFDEAWKVGEWDSEPYHGTPDANRLPKLTGRGEGKVLYRARRQVIRYRGFAGKEGDSKQNICKGWKGSRGVMAQEGGGARRHFTQLTEQRSARKKSQGKKDKELWSRAKGTWQWGGFSGVFAEIGSS